MVLVLTLIQLIVIEVFAPLLYYEVRKAEYSNFNKIPWVVIIIINNYIKLHNNMYVNKLYFTKLPFVSVLLEYCILYQENLIGGKLW